MKQTNSIFVLAILSLCYGLFASCSSDLVAEDSSEARITSPLQISACVQDKGISGNQMASSRATESDDEGNYAIMTTTEWGDWTVYIHQQVGNESKGTLPYKVKDGLSGILVSANAEKPLSWGTSDSQHMFHAWTQPSGVSIPEGGTTGTIDFSVANKEYEHFIGTCKGPVSYATNGAMVDLKFKRLASRIVLGSVKHTKSDHSIDYNAAISVVSLTFPHPARTATFDTGIGTDEWPAVKDAPNSAHGLSMKRSDFVKDELVRLYVPPFRFAEKQSDGKWASTGLGEFFIVFGLPSINTDGTTIPPATYSFDLASIADTIPEIKAGESLVLNLEIKDDSIPGVYVYLQPWNTNAESDIMHKPSPGIYNQTDFLRMLDAIGKGEEVPEDLVYTDSSGKKVIRLFCQLDFGNERGEFTIPDGYTLDGLGHNIKCGSLTLHGDVKNLFINGTKVS